MNAERLLKLADHLEFGKLGHDKFHFGVIHTKMGFGNTCQSLGCAIGEMPFIWPQEFWFEGGDVYSEKYYPKEDVSEDRSFDILSLSFQIAATFFEINGEDAGGLFCPYRNRKWDLKKLKTTANKSEVAQGIRQFVDWKQKQTETALNDAD